MIFVLANLLHLIFRVFTLSIIIDALLSWVPVYNDTVYKIRSVLQKITNPVMRPIRKLMMPVTQRIMIDLSPIVAIFIVQLIERILFTILFF